MVKIRKIKFLHHPFLGNFSLDFLGQNGKAVDTVFLAGENGTGKSTIIESLYGFFSKPICDMSVELEKDNEIIEVTIRLDGPNSWRSHARDNDGRTIPYSHTDVFAIFSDVEINYNATAVKSVTSMNLDEETISRKSSGNLATIINQLLVDIDSQDAASIAKAVRNNSKLSYESLNVEEKMTRFKNAFSIMFKDLEYSHVENENGRKVVYFKKDGVAVPIDGLSSGEKQIVYRGCFLLKDINALKSPIVFIDEPEISLHPEWQEKIMDYYKAMFTNTSGVQTSQIFVVTHSPFIIHSKRRFNDKVIVLSRDEDGMVYAIDKPEYYNCNSFEMVRDAFNIEADSFSIPTVYLEGRTDELYFNKAMEVFGIESPFRFKWIGYLDDRGQEVNTGSGSLDKAASFLTGLNLPVKNIFLYDCDTKKAPTNKNNVFIRCIERFENKQGMTRGIENALDLANIDLSSFYASKEKIGDYGEVSTITEFKKMDLCKHICKLDKETLKVVFANLESVIREIVSI